MAYREYTLEDLIPFGGTKQTQAQNAAELRQLRAIVKAAWRFLDKWDQGDGGDIDTCDAADALRAALVAAPGGDGAEGGEG